MDFGLPVMDASIFEANTAGTVKYKIKKEQTNFRIPKEKSRLDF